MSKKLKTKRLIDKYVAEWEADQLLSNKIARTRARLGYKSKVAGASSRRDPIEDTKIFQQIWASMGKGCDTVLASGKKPLVQRWKDKIYLKNKEINPETGKEIRTIWVPDWTHTGDRLKLLALGASMTGEVHAFTLKLGKREIEAAYNSPRGFVGYFTERMKRAFSKAGDPSPQYAFMLEASPVHEVHIHGIISSSITKVRPILAEVGGATDMAAKERQVDVQKVYNLLGWARYIAKAPLMTADTLHWARKKRSLPERRDTLIGAPTRSRAAAKDWYQTQRKSGSPIPMTLGGSRDGAVSILDSLKGK